VPLEMVGALIVVVLPFTQVMVPPPSSEVMAIG
jgi:hypothetical protein